MSWRRFLNRKKWDRERREEIESYIQIETEDKIARGPGKYYVAADEEFDASAASVARLWASIIVRPAFDKQATAGDPGGSSLASR
jgi:hypothetical protein